jgi:glucose dehydrogenase
MNLAVKSTTTLSRVAVMAMLTGLAACGRHEATTSLGHEARFADVDDARLAAAAAEPQNWLIYNGGWQEQRFSALAQQPIEPCVRR